MPILRHIEIKHFRAIDHLSWHVKPGLNCIIGPGDSGKSTVLDAIELVLTERQNARFSDADFHNLDVSEPIEITATFGELPPRI